MDRIKLIRVLLTVIFSILVFYLLNLQLFRGHEFRKLSNNNCIRLLPQDGSRGAITDDTGSAIVSSRLCYDVMIMPQDTLDVDTLLARVAQILGKPLSGLKKNFSQGLVSDYLAVTIAKNIPAQKAIILEELKQDLDGIVIQPMPQREYPYAGLGCHILGYLSEIDHWRLSALEGYGYQKKDIVGFGGVEEKYDYYLQPKEGGLSIEVDHRGRLIRALGVKPPHNGKEIQLTINAQIQEIVEDCIGDRKGCAIIMDPYTGAVVAMASRPGFNPDWFIQKSSSLNGLFNSPDGVFLNRAISAVYPAGSVFKLVVAAAALENGKINTATHFSCNGGLEIGSQRFACWNTHGDENIYDALTHSCNVFFYHTGLAAGPNAIYDYALKFGFGRQTGIDLPYEKSGFIPSPLWKKVYRLKKWLNGDTANLSIGQSEVTVSPLQVLRMIAVFANQGYLVTPYIVKAVDKQDISSYQQKIYSLGLKKSTMDIIRKGLRSVVQNDSGTAHVIDNVGVSAAGKTGTAQAPPGAAHGWFAGFFPYIKPQYALCVFLEHGGSGYQSAVVARRIIERMVQEKLISTGAGNE